MLSTRAKQRIQSVVALVVATAATIIAERFVSTTLAVVVLLFGLLILALLNRKQVTRNWFGWRQGAREKLLPILSAATSISLLYLVVAIIFSSYSPELAPPNSFQPGASPPTFTPVLGPYSVIVGKERFLVSEENTRLNPTKLKVAENGISTLKAYVEKGRIYVEAQLLTDDKKLAVEIKQNTFTTPPPNWDANFDASSLEVVDHFQTPRFQMVYVDPRTVIVNGLDQYARDGGLLFAVEGSSMRSLFEYPSALHFGVRRR